MSPKKLQAKPLDLESQQLDDNRDVGPRSPLRTLQVLHELAISGHGVPLSVLAELLDLPKTSLFRLLRSLESGGYVTSVNGVHEVGPETVKLGSAIMQGREFPKTARPVMERLSKASNETIILGSLDDTGTQVVYSEVIDATNPLRFMIKTGTVRPLYTSASGLAILAYMQAAELAAYLEEVKFVRYAPGTITSVTALKRRIKEVRARGTAISIDGMFEGVFSIAAPVVNAMGIVRCGLSISAPSTRGIRQQEKFAQILTQAGGEVSRLLGYGGIYPPL
ncbi:MAG: IclR family transcriptional regulator [Rhodoferax sp.]|nr:IclR family transcriptional regulator [Rhodoferax sp.]